MKVVTRVFLTRLSSSPSSSSSGFRNVAQRNAYCTLTTTNPKRHNSKKDEQSLYRRISPLGNPNVSIVPVIDQWLLEGRTVSDANLRFIIKELRHYRRFKHALQVSNWMSEKRITQLTVADAAVRLDLIALVHGVEEAEDYFNNTPKELRTLEVHGALLNVYARAKCVDKAESVMQKMKELGFASYSMSHNVMLNLYCRTRNREKFDALLLEMESNNIKFDNFTYGIILNFYGGEPDSDEMDKILAKMESDPELDVDWMTYATAAKQFLRAQLVDKALDSLRKSEKLVELYKKKNEAYSYIITLYATAGKKEEVLRVWEECKKCKATNRDYISLIPSILKFNDLETTEKIFKEWEDSNLLKDIRIPNFLISNYCENGMIEKAEALLERVKSEKWQKTDSFTWAWMSFGYVKSNQMPKAVEAMESALLEFNPQVCWKARKETLAACLKYLKDEGDSERLNAIIETLKDKCLIPAKIHEKLVEYVSGECAIEDVFKGDSVEGAASN